MAQVIENKLLKQAELFERDPLQDVIRQEIRRVIERVLGEEIKAAVGAGSYERTEGRVGYRHGTRQRNLSTSAGAVQVEVPRGRLFKADGSTEEFESEVLRRYKRRTKQVDDAILAIYLSGCNTRRVKMALRPLLRGVPLSKSTISRLVAGLKEEFEAWRGRRLDEEKIVYVYADAIHIKVRMAGRVSKVPVLGTVGVRETGEKVLLSLDLMGSESTETWRSALQGLVDRGLRRPLLVIADGGDGLLNAIEMVWPGVDVQRCTVHKLRNILAHAPEHAHADLEVDYNRIVYARSSAAARAAKEFFMRKWGKRCPGAAKSLEEAGDWLFTFFKYPQAQWKSLRTTNVIERVNGEFRRRVKTQASLPTEDAVLLVLFGLVASGQIRMRRINGWQEMHRVVLTPKMDAASGAS